MKKLIVALFTLVIFISGCSSSTGEAVVTGGSTSVEPLFAAMIEDYNAENPDLTPITYDSTGSSAGIENTLNSSYDVGTLSREISDDEVTDDNLETEVLAFDGIAVVVNPENEVSNLTIKQIKDIFTGKITNWSEVGGADAEIAIISRDSASGTRSAFEEIVGFEGELSTDALESGSNGEILTNVSQNKNAIGYASFDYLDDSVKALDVNGVAPNTANVVNETYTISRPFNMVWLSNNDNEDVINFVNWVKENKDDYVSEFGLIGA